MNSEEQRQRKRVLASEVGNACKFRRKQARLSVRDIANKTGYSTQLIYSFEAGKTTNYILLFDCYFNLLGDKRKYLMDDIMNLIR